MENRMTAQQLKNSILQMAVQGKLVSQDPNDEPASVLLERIRKEKEQLIRDGKIKKNKKESYIFRGADNLHYEQIGKEVRCIEDELPFEIPDSWQWCRFNQLFKLTSGQDLTADKFNSTCKGTPYITGASNLENGSVIINRWTTEPKSFAYSGDLLLTCKGTIGKLAFLTVEKAHIARQIMSIASPYKIDLCYIKIILELDIINLKAKAKSMIPGISRDDVLSILIPVPPINEQIRIVNYLNLLEPLIQKYKKTEEQLFELNSTIKEQLKKSILQYAIEGKLVPQDSTDEPASVLLERIRVEKQKLIAKGKIKKDKNESIIYRRDNSYYEQLDKIENCIDEEIPFDIPSNWIWSRFQSATLYITDYVANGSFASLRENVKTYKEKNYALMVKTQDFSNNFKHGLTYTDKTGFDYLQKSRLYGGELMLSNIGASIGKAFIIPCMDIPMTLAPNSIVIKCLNNTLTQYISLYILSPYGQKKLQDFTAGTAMPKFSKTQLRSSLLPIPPIYEQKRMLSKLDLLNQLIETL